MNPTVSVVMAARDAAAHLPATLESLFAQTLADWELIVADDCSTDGTRALIGGCADQRIKLVSLARPAGIATARNRAFARASGRYVAGLEPGDLCHPERFARQVAWLDAHPRAVLIASAVALRHDRGAHRTPHFPTGLSPAQIDWLLHLRNPLAWSSVLFRAEAARRIEPFQRTRHAGVEDFDFYHRLRPFGTFAQLRHELTVHRVAADAHDARESAARVLAEAHFTLLDVPAPEATGLIADHVLARQPVPDMATLAMLFDVLALLRRELVDARGYRRSEQVEIDRALLDLWWEVARRGVRSGALPLRKTLAASPARPDLTRTAELYVSGLMGQVLARRA